MPRDGAWRAVSGDLRRTFYLGGKPGDFSICAASSVPGLAGVGASGRAQGRKSAEDLAAMERRLERMNSLGDRIAERADALDRDRHKIAMREGEIVFGNNARARHKAGAGGECVVTEEITD